MNAETRMTRILASDDSPSLKILKLQNLALRCFPSSPNQLEVQAAYTQLQEQHSAAYKATIARLAETATKL